MTSGNEKESDNMMHDSEQITQSAATEKNDSLIYETFSEMAKCRPPTLEIQDKATLPISDTLLVY